MKWIKLQLVIKDNGVGISAENIEKLFKDYSKLDEHAGMNQKGTGLGLSICKNLIMKMGGTVKVESVLGQGSSFIITIQLKVRDRVVGLPKAMLLEKKEKIFKMMGAFIYSEAFTQKYQKD